jgi:hypothetical protein
MLIIVSYADKLLSLGKQKLLHLSLNPKQSKEQAGLI